MSELQSSAGLLFNPQVIMSLDSYGGMILTGKTQELINKTVLLYPSKILYGLTRVRTHASAVRGRRLTASAMERSVELPEVHKSPSLVPILSLSNLVNNVVP
jgi:hypothetical protein